jgi:nucleotide-binding universal stress UspA family protein
VATRPVVLGYDGSDEAKAALDETIRLFTGTGTEVVVVFAYDISPLDGAAVADFKAELDRIADQETTRALEDLEAAGIEATALHVSGKPADAIIEAALETAARMIVVGSPKRGPLASAVLGPVVLSLAQRSPAPLLVVPVPDA